MLHRRRFLQGSVLGGLALALGWRPALPRSCPRPVGDGVTDDTAALQCMIDTASGPLTIGPGSYLITAPIRISGSDRLIRDSKFTMIGSDGPLFILEPDARNVEIRNNWM